MEGALWLGIVVRQFESARSLAERALAQVDEAEFARVPAPGANSLAVLVHHVGGNLRSRWTNFLTSDGEKPDRDRDREFEEGRLSRAQCTAIWEQGWGACLGTLRSLAPADLERTVTIRGEPWGVIAAIQRSLSHTDHHAGQIVQLARQHAGPRWSTLSIPRGGSGAFLEAMRRRHGGSWRRSLRRVLTRHRTLPRLRAERGTVARRAFRKRVAGPRAGLSEAVFGGGVRWVGDLHGRAPVTLDDASTELERRQSQADFLSLAETLSSLIALIDGDVLSYVNPAGCELLGRGRDWYAGRPFWEVVHPDDRPGAIARARARQSGVPQPKRLVERLVHADGRTLWVDYSIDRIVLGGKTLTLVTGNDISERKRIEAELRASEARLAEAQRIGSIGSWELDIPSDRLCWSAELCRIYGVEPPRFGATLEGYLELVHPDDREHAIRHLRAAQERGGTFAFEHRIVKPDGDVRLIFGRGEFFADAEGQLVRAAGTGQDITERRRTEEELRRSEARFRNLLRQAPVMLLSFDQDGRVRDVSDYWLETTGYARSEVVGKDGWSFITEESRERKLAMIEECRRNDEIVIQNLPIRGLCKDGRQIDLLSTSVAELDDSGAKLGAICVQVNLTDLQRAEDALRESAERYRVLVEHAPEAITVLDVDLDRFVDANAHAEKLFGTTREQLLGMGPLDFCTEHQAGGRASCELYEEENRLVLEGEERVFEFTHVDARGREIHCQTRLSRLPAVGRRLIRATTTDISELKRLEERMRRADRLAAAGALAAGVAHEIGNPLMALSMAAQSLERREGDEYTHKKLALIREHSERISRIVRQMSELARPQAGARARCDVNDVVRRAIEMVRFDERARNAEIRYELDAKLPEVDAVEDELSQVCINLALNAFDAMAANPPDRPRRLSIRSWSTERSVHFAFRDSGPGVAPKLRDKLFQPFVTTKEAGRGSGLGLSVSYRILEEHGGALRLEPDDGGGATFAFELPQLPRGDLA